MISHTNELSAQQTKFRPIFLRYKEIKTGLRDRNGVGTFRHLFDLRTSEPIFTKLGMNVTPMHTAVNLLRLRVR